MSYPFPGRPFPRIILDLPEELQAPSFIREMREQEDIVGLLYWSGAIADLKAAIMSGDLDRIEKVLEKIRQDGHADKVAEMMDHKSRVAEYLAGADEITVGIIIVGEAGE